MSNKTQQLRKALVPVLTVLLVTAVTLAQSDAGSALLAAIHVVVSAQPSGF